MSLQKALVPIILNGGLDTKSDSKIVAQGKLLKMENCFMQKGGSLQVRNGYDLVGKPPLNIQFASITKDNELLVVADSNLYSYNSTINTWNDKGSLPLTVVNKESIWSDIYTQTYCDISGSDLLLSTWQDSQGGVFYSLLDNNSKEIVIPKTLVSATGSLPRCLTIGNFGYVVYQEASNVIACMIINMITRVSSIANIAVDSKNTVMDCITFGNAIILAYKDTSDHTIICYITPLGLVGSLANGYVNPIAITDHVITLNIAKGKPIVGSETINLIYATGTSLNIREYDQALTQINTTTTLATTTADISNIGSVYSNDVFHIIYSDVNTGIFTTSKYIKYTLSTGGVVISALPYRLHIAGNPFIISNNIKAPFFYRSKDGLQDKMFIISSDGTTEAVCSDILFSTAVGRTQNCINGLIAAPIKTRLQSENGTLFSQTGVGLLTISEEIPSVGKRSSDITLFTGGYIRQYDGSQVVEAQFLLSPERPDIVTDATSGSLANGAYQYILVWEWIDAKSRRLQSATSIATTYTHSTGSSSKLTTWSLPATAINSRISLAVYRTTASGTVFYKVSSDSAPTIIVPTDTSVSFIDTLADASIISREILYTTGGVLDNINLGKASTILLTKTRAFIGGLEDENQIAYSKLIRKGSGINFNDTLVLQVNPEGGRVVGIDDMDDKVVIFKERSIYASTGDGPSDTGQGSSITLPQFITGDVGCIDNRSLVKVPLGIMFKSGKGIYLLDRGLTTTYIGAEVEAYNYLTITGASVATDTNQVRFTSQEGITLVYDYFWKQWSVFTNLPSVGSFIWNNKHTIVNDLAILSQSSGYTDAGAPIVMKLETSWISTAGLSGFQRIYRTQLLGNYVGVHSLKVNCFYDYKAYSQDTHIWDSTVGMQAYGETSYGGGNFGGTNDGTYRVEIRNTIQKCTAFKLSIESIFPNGIPTGAFELTSLTLQVGVKAGLNKMSTDRHSN